MQNSSLFTFVGQIILNGSGNESFYTYQDYPSIPDEPLFHLLSKLEQYGLPTLFTVGIILNVLSGIIISKTELIKVTPFVYLMAFSVVDSMYLLAKIVPWASGRVYNVYVIAGMCQVFYYLSFLTNFLEWWITVMLLCERNYVLFKPDNSRKYCSPFRTKCALIVISVFAIVCHLYLTWTSAVIEHNGMKMCMVIPENVEDINVLRKIDTAFSFIVPIFVTLSLIVSALVKWAIGPSKARRDIRGFSSASVVIRRQSNDYQSIKQKPEYLIGFNPKLFTTRRRITFKIIIIVLFILLICLPHDALKARLILLNGGHTATLQEIGWLRLMSEIYAINFGLKGVLYFIIFPEFRMAAWRLIQVNLLSKCNKEEKEMCTEV